MKKDQTNIYKKITKISLVIYCSVIAACFFAFLIASTVTVQYSYLNGFLLCLFPGIIFILVSCLLPIPRLVDAKAGKGVIAWYIVAYVLKYALIVGIPFVGLTFYEHFNRWVMLATTLIAPITIFISKIKFANYVSKSSKKAQK